jgi:MoxR-like ATPase
VEERHDVSIAAEHLIATSDNQRDVAFIAEFARRFGENIAKVIVGKSDSIELVLVCLLCEGHILIEDVPGVGKTTLARAVARSIAGEFRRIQFTPDLLPSDITGISVFDQKSSDFRFRSGPVFANIVLADEINRATPRAQSALLESMEERTVTVDGDTMPLPRPFMVLATENPIELEGTFPLPEAQLDRFLMRLELGYPTHDEEIAILRRSQDRDPLPGIDAVTSSGEVAAAAVTCRRIHVSDDIVRYLTAIVRASRSHEAIALGGSPRASLALFRSSQALAAIHGRAYVIPDDVKRLIKPVIGHRLLLSSDSRLRGRTLNMILDEITASVAVPMEGSIGLPSGSIQ